VAASRGRGIGAFGQPFTPLAISGAVLAQPGQVAISDQAVTALALSDEEVTKVPFTDEAMTKLALGDEEATRLSITDEPR